MKLVLTIVFAAWASAAGVGAAERRPVEKKPYHQVLRESEVVVIASELGGDVGTHRDYEGPPPGPRTIVEGGVLRKLSPRTRSWFEPDLAGQPRVSRYRGKVRVLNSFKGAVAPQSELEVDFYFGVDPVVISEYWQRFKTTQRALYREWRDPEGELGEDDDERAWVFVLHLRRDSDGTGKKGETYQLTTEPWVIPRARLAAHVEEMQIRMRRFAAMENIDRKVAKLGTLTNAEREGLWSTIKGEKVELGKIRYTAREKAVFDRLQHLDKASVKWTEDVRRLWASERDRYIELPFRIVLGENN